MSNPLTMKLEQFTAFSEENRRRLDALVGGKRRTWRAKQDILSEGDNPAKSTSCCQAWPRATRTCPAAIGRSLRS